MKRWKDLPNQNGKFSLEELLNQDALTELKELKKASENWRRDKHDHNYTQLKTISLTLEVIITLLERQDDKYKRLE